MRQIASSAAVGQEVKDGIEDFTHVGGTWSSATVGGNKGADDVPLDIGQVGCVGSSGEEGMFHCFLP